MKKLFITLLGLGPIATTAHAADCGALMSLGLTNAEITSAETVAPGAFRVGENERRAAATNLTMQELPAFCRATATLRPTTDSEIKIEIWMPAANWNNKLQSVGNGGWAGTISYGALANAVASGYAAASTDTGHEGGEVNFAIGHPEKVIDFAYRAVHEMTNAAKRIIARHYGEPPRNAYFVGCSTGGRQALAEAQRYPSDYDGVIAGAPAYYPTHLHGMQVWTGAMTHRSEVSALSSNELQLVNAAAVNACDTLDGVADGVIENPMRCDFDPSELMCGQQADATCLNAEQIETVRLTYRGPQSADGASLFPGLVRGSELGWNSLGGPEPLSIAADTYRHLVLNDPDWSHFDFDAERDMAKGVTAIGEIMNSNDPNLAPFTTRGGKLLLYHGWNDPGIPAKGTINYVQTVRETIGQEQAQSGVRLFMVPGMNHCAGGVGTDQFDAVAALDAWVQTDEAPSRIEAARVEGTTVVRTRPLCPHPQTAVYTGAGDSDSSENFVCR